MPMGRPLVSFEKVLFDEFYRKNGAYTCMEAH